jgi:plastocyanin
MDEGQNENTPTYAKRPIWQWLLFMIIIAIVLLGGGYYLFAKNNNSYSLNTQNTQVARSSPTQMPTVTVSATQAASMKKITVDGTEFAFIPSIITVSKGDTVEITFKNMGKFPHNLAIAGLGVKTKTIQPGGQDTISFTPVNLGSFQFLCTVPGHADRGMTGNLIVK